MSRVKSTRSAILSGDQGESIYLARIAELEAEVQALTAELERYKALALSGANVRLAKDSTPGVPDLGRPSAPPIHITADGTQGMRRGVSGRRTPASEEGDK